MAPTLVPGDWALTIPLRVRDRRRRRRRTPGPPGLRDGEAHHAAPGDPVDERALGPDEWWVEGDFADASTDSRRSAPSGDGLKGKVVLVYWPKERRGRV